MRMVKTWLKLCNGFVVVVIPELFLFLTFYNLYQPSSILGVILCIFKLVLYFHKINLVSAYARQHQLTASYPSDGSITPDVPSYGAFAPPSYEDAIKSRDGVPLPDGNYNPVNEKETWDSLLGNPPLDPLTSIKKTRIKLLKTGKDSLIIMILAMRLNLVSERKSNYINSKIHSFVLKFSHVWVFTFESPRLAHL